MSVEGWVRWCRSRGALAWTIAAVFSFLVCSWLDRSGGCEYVSYEDGVLLPINLPFKLDTHAQRVAYATLLDVLGVVTPPLMGVTLVLLGGVLWSHAMGSARIAFLPTLVTLFAAVLLLADGALGLTWSTLLADTPAWVSNASLVVGAWVRPVAFASLLLVALGFLALLVRVFQVHVLRPSRAFDKSRGSQVG